MEPNSINSGAVANIISAILLFFTLLESRKITKLTLIRDFRSTILVEGTLVWSEVDEILTSESSLFVENAYLKAHHNIAYNINGSIIVNEKKYRLFFRNSATSPTVVGSFEWAWLDGKREGSVLFMGIDKSSYESTILKNCIEIFYEDGMKNKYKFFMTEDYNQSIEELI